MGLFYLPIQNTPACCRTQAQPQSGKQSPADMKPQKSTHAKDSTYRRCKLCGALAWCNFGRVCKECELERNDEIKEAVRRACPEPWHPK
jgi:hypothetical protein